MKRVKRSRAILGLDIGGTKTTVVVGTYNGNILHRRSFPTFTHYGFKQSFSAICRHVRNGLTWARKRSLSIDAMSVSIGGPLDIKKGIIYSPPNLPRWDNIPLKELLEEKFSLPAFIEHDGNAGALAEYFFGAGRGHGNIVFLTLGTGLGAGIILNGRLYRGTNDNAGEVGHIRISPSGPEAYGKKGSWEGYCSGSGIAKLAARMYPRHWKATTTAQDISAAARRGDAHAIKVIQRSGKFFGRGLAILADVLNPEIIILGSLGVRLGNLFLSPALKEMKREATPRAFSATKVVPSALGERIGDVASLCAAIQHARIQKRANL